MSFNWKKSSSIALLALVGITAIWGWTFLVVKDAIGRLPVMDFLTWRFGVAVLVMLALRPGCLKGMSRTGVLRGIGLGIVLGIGYITQTYGLLWASAAVSGFITGTFVVLTPLVSWVILRRKISRNLWLAVALATAGLALISLHGWSVGPGELLTLACAFSYAFHIVGLGEWSSQHDIYGFSLLQLATVAVISLISALPGGIEVPPDGDVWAAVGITAVLASALAFIVQTWAQSLVSPTRAAVVMTMEPVFAGVFAVLIGGEVLTSRVMAGAGCVLLAMLLVNLKPAAGFLRTEGAEKY